MAVARQLHPGVCPLAGDPAGAVAGVSAGSLGARRPGRPALFTAPLLAWPSCWNVRARSLAAPGALLVGFSGSWLAGSLFWGWCRLHPLWHLPIEAFALPLALAGLGGRWRWAGAFYLAALLGTAATDAVMALTGLMDLWPMCCRPARAKAPCCCRAQPSQALQPCPLTVLLGGSLLAGD